MTRCNTFKAKLSNSLLSKLKSGIKDSTELTLNLSSNSNDETGFSHKLLLTNTQVLRLCIHSQIIHQLIQNS